MFCCKGTERKEYFMKKSIFWLLICYICMVVFMPAVSADDYDSYMSQAKEAAKIGKYAAMESAIKNALKHGEGDEYAWRSLAAAQELQGKCEESLETARENVRRNGETGWSLQQLASSALINADYDLARKTLDKAEQLPADLLKGSEGALNLTRKRLESATTVRTYKLEFKHDLGQGGPTEKPVWLLVPQKDSVLHSCEYTDVRNVVSWKLHHVGILDYIELVQKPGEPFYIDSTAVFKPFCLGQERLSKVPPGDCPVELEVYLVKFQVGEWWDPNDPAVQKLVPELKGKTSAETVQNILDWFNKNIHYDATIQNIPGLGSLGSTIKLGYGGCYHLSGTFVTLCRAAGVPACVMHGNALPMADDFTTSLFGHGWAEVYINSIGWVPVEPTDVNSLRMFTLNRFYMTVGSSNRPPADRQFSPDIEYEGEKYSVISIQGCPQLKGELIKRENPEDSKQ